MASPNPLIPEIDRFCERHGIAPTTFGLKAVNDGKLVERLRNGGRMWPETEERIRSYIAGHNRGPTE